MGNMSATILRNIVGAVFPVKTSSVILSGEISPEHVFQLDRGHSWWNGASEQTDCAWGFDPKTGFKAITGMSEYKDITELYEWTLGREYSYSDNGECEHEPGNQLRDLPGVEKFAFFLVNSQGKGYGEQAEYYDTWTLYKAPNFAQKWVEIEDRQGYTYRILQFCWCEPVQPTAKIETPKRLLDYKRNYNNWARQLTWLI